MTAIPLILSPLSLLYSAVTRTRLAAYEKGLFSITRLNSPVISVGNITTGGTGKTPLVEWISRNLASKGKRVCVLTRGYGRSNPEARTVVSDGTRILADPGDAGDEPFQLAQSLKGLAAVVCDSDRVAAGRWAIRKFGTDVFVLDDGFQHLRIARDLNIATVDATNPWGGGRLLPRGRLRESPRGLARADCIVVTRAEQAGDLTALRQELQKLASAPVFISRMGTRSIRTVTGESQQTSALGSGQLAAFCAIGNPESFFEHLRREGHTPIFVRAFPDHHVYDQSEIDTLVLEARRLGAPGLITTAKDAVKLQGLDFTLPCYVLEIDIVIEEADKLTAMLDRAVSLHSSVVP